MLCEVLTEINFPQVFLWMQEKSLLSMGALLQNDNPGIPFSAGDLARNLLLSEIVMGGEWNPTDQERVYNEEWILPLVVPAKLLPDKQGLDGLVASFIKNIHSGAGNADGAIFTAAAKAATGSQSSIFPSALLRETQIGK